MTLHALQSDNFVNARNTITMRTMGYDIDATILLDLTDLEDGAHTGLACIGRGNQLIGIVKEGDEIYFYSNFQQPRIHYAKDRNRTVFFDKEERLHCPSGTPTTHIYLRIHFDLRTQKCRFYCSLDGQKYSLVGKSFPVEFGNWKGVRWGIYHYNTLGKGGSVTATIIQ